jgi:large repetitive protein
MRKCFSAQYVFLASLLIVIQLLLPITNVYAASTLLPPSNLSSQLLTPDDVKLSWSAVYQATGYNIYQISNGQMSMLGTTKSNYYTINNLPEGSYMYVVSTLSLDGESGPGAPITVDIVYPDLAAPATLTNIIKNGNDIVLSWSASSYAQTYNVYQIGTDGSKTLIDSVTGTTYTVSNSPEGTNTFAVSAVNSLYGESPLSKELEVNVVYPTMAVPANFKYSITNGNNVNLSWSSVLYATGYKVYQIKNEQETLIATVTGTSTLLSNLAAGDYTYVVHSYSDRFGESAGSDPVSLTVDTVTIVPPSNFVYQILNGNDIKLSWGSVLYATSYKVYQVIDGQEVLKSTVTGTSVTYAKQPAGDYTFVVHAYSSIYGESADSNLVSLTIDTVTMLAPTNFAYAIKNGNDIALTWDAMPNATSYKVYQISNGQKVLKSTVTGTSVTYANQPVGDYTFEVKSFSSSFGESAEGSQVSLSLVFPLMQPPANVVQTIKDATSFSLNWEPADYATSYKVYQIINGQKVLKNTVTGTTAAFANMAPGDYTYEVHSYSSRFGESANGTQLTFTLNGQSMQAPTNLTYSIANGNDVTLKWTAVPYATSYKVYQVVNGEAVLKSTVTSTSATLTNQPEGDYDFIVDSVSTLLGESPTGAEVTFSLVFPTMAAPQNFTYSIQNGNSVVLKWGTVPYATSYKVYELIDGQEVLKATTSYLSTTLTNVAAGDHTYVVHSSSTRFGDSDGAQLTMTMSLITMQPPTNLTGTIVNGNSIVLRWNSSTYATAYKVYQIVDGQEVLKSTVTSTSVTYTNQPAGDYTFVVHSYSDRFGESAGSDPVSATVNNIMMEPPTNLTQTIVNGNDIVLRWNSSTYATAYKVYQVVDGQEVLKSTVMGTSVTYTNQPAGDYTFVVHSYCDRFGESADSAPIFVTVNNITMEPPANLTQTITNGNTIVLKWSSSTYATSYKIYQVVDGQEVLKSTVTGTSVTYLNQPEGEYTFVVYSYSTKFGQSPSGSTVNFTLVWPVVQPPVLSDTVFNANNITLTWKAVQWANEYRVYDLSSGSPVLIYKGTALSYKIYNLSEATHSYIVTAYNKTFGESAPSNVISEDIIYPVMQPPTARLQLLSPTSAVLSWDFVPYSNGYNVYEIIDGKPVLLVQNLNNISYTLSNLTYANHQYYVTSYSNSFGESKPSNIVTAELIVDTLPPATTANVPDGWINQKADITLLATDDITGVAHTYYSINGAPFVEGTTFTIDQEGINKISFYSVDNAGNKEAIQTVEVKIDKTAPVTTSNTPTTWTNTDVNVTLNATDTGSGVAHTYYSINGAAFIEGTTFTIDQEGSNKIAFYSVDNAGNKEAVQTIEVKIDKTTPVVSMDLNNEYKLGISLQLSYLATDSLSGVLSQKMTVNGPNTTVGTEVVNGDNVILDQPGVYTVWVTVTDAAGNTATLQKQFTVYIPANIEVTPTVIKGNSGVFTVRVSLPLGFSTQELDLNTVTLNGVQALNSNNGYYNQAKNGQFKFEREDFNWTQSTVTVEFRGYVNGYLVIGQTNVKVQR